MSMKSLCLSLYWSAACLVSLTPALGTAAEPVKVKVFAASMFEIGKNTGDRAGEFQHWYERYWKDSEPVAVKGALNPVYCDGDGVCGSVRWTPDMRQVAMRESCSYKRPRNRSSHEAVTAEAQRDV